MAGATSDESTRLKTASGFRVGEFWVEPRANEIGSVRVDAKAMDVLVVLAEAAPDVVSVDTLLNRVWPDVVVVDSVVHRVIARLRKAFGDEAHVPHYIESIPRRGYRLIAPLERQRVQSAPETLPAAPTPSAPPEARESPILTTPRRVGRKPVLLGACAVAMLAGLVAVALYNDPDASKELSDVNDGRVEIGVFDPLTKSEDLSSFAERLTDAMVRVFAAGGIRTMGRAQVGASKGIGADPGPEFVLRGTVDRVDEKLLVNADLVHRRDGLVLWSTAMQWDAADLRRLAAATSIRLANVVRCALDNRALSKDPSPDLLTKLLRYCEALRSRGRNDNEEALDLARALVEAAPQNAWFHVIQALVAAAATMGPTVTGARRPHEEIVRLRKLVYDSVNTAIALDPSANVYMALANVDDPDVGLAQRERLLQKSLSMNFNKLGNMYAYGNYASLLDRVGRQRDARFYFERSVKAYPLDRRPLRNAAFLTAASGDMSVARNLFESAEEKHPDEGIEFARFGAELWFGDPTIAQDMLRAKPFRSTECLRTFLDARVKQIHLSERQLDAACASESFGPGNQEALYAYFGHVDAAFRAIEAHIDDYLRLGTTTGYLFLPMMRPIHFDARFMPIAARLGLVEYWLESNQWPDFCKDEQLPYDCKTAALAARANAPSKAR